MITLRLKKGDRFFTNRVWEFFLLRKGRLYSVENYPVGVVMLEMLSEPSDTVMRQITLAELKKRFSSA